MELLDSKVCGLMVRYMDMERLFGARLDELNKNSKSSTTKIDTANLYISLESLYNLFRKPNYEDAFESLSKKELKAAYRHCVSAMINVAAHYREYFKRHQIRTNIVFYYNEITDDFTKYNNSGLNPDYRMHWFNSLHRMDRWAINNMVMDSIPIMKIICDYLEDVYMVSVTHLESSMVPFMIHMQGELPTNMNVIVTNDPYDFNYCNYNFMIITKYAMQPMVLTKRNLIPFASFRLGNEYEPPAKIHPRLFPFILACCGDKKRSIPKVAKLGYRTIYKNLMKLYDAGYIFDEDPDTMNIQNLLHVLNNESFHILTKEGVASAIMGNYKVMDYETQYKQISKTQFKKTFHQLTNKTDINALVDLNERYFGDFPLKLMEQNQYNRHHDSKELGDLYDG